MPSTIKEKILEVSAANEVGTDRVKTVDAQGRAYATGKRKNAAHFVIDELSKIFITGGNHR